MTRNDSERTRESTSCNGHGDDTDDHEACPLEVRHDSAAEQVTFLVPDPEDGTAVTEWLRIDATHVVDTREMQ
ncbi:hypothetical protein [Halorubellus salinus]|uniref:hypothetical protein n=1 Tax=Halorubellus salinus TaxID=755309 RepID=UPI001D07E7B9|nr:hypothetical protein [Halorubellus salinus]